MKRNFLSDLSKFFICGILTIFMFSCQDVTNAKVVGDSYGNKVIVNLTAQTEDQLTGALSDFSSNSRSILPDVFSAGDLDFTLCGFSGRGNTVGVNGSGVADPEAEVEIEFNDTYETKSAAKVELAFDRWQLTLKAYKNGDLVLQGSTFIDLTNGGAEIPFILSSRGVTTTGGSNLHFRVIDSQGKLASVKAGFYDKETGNEITGKTLTINALTTNGDYKSFGASIDGLTPGTYMYKIYFYSGDTQPKQLGFWSDLIVIDAGNTTVETNTTNSVITENGQAYIDLGNILNKAPAAPSDLNAYLVDGSTTNDSYKVHITWEDNSNNEEYFVLTVKEYTNPTTEGDVYFTNSDQATANFAAWNGRVSGSLLSGNEEVVITLPTGRLFDITLLARNAIGDSTVATRVADGNTIANETLYEVDNNARINRVVITHHLNGGTLTESGNPYTGGDSYYTKETYAGVNIPVLAIDGSTKVLTKNSHPFVKWVDTASDHYTAEITETDWHNIDCYAFYNQDYYLTYEQEGWEDMDAARVTATYLDNAVNQNCKNGEVVATTEKTITITIDGTLGTYEDEREYDYFEFYINGVSYQAGTSNVLTLSTTDLNSQVYVFNACARSGSQWYCNTFHIQISR